MSHSFRYNPLRHLENHARALCRAQYYADAFAAMLHTRLTHRQAVALLEEEARMDAQVAALEALRVMQITLGE